MRQFLYITPFFPPQNQVGALRPLKFARHLPQHGWQPIILCDAQPGVGDDAGLGDLLPAGVVVVRDYSPRAQLAGLRRTPKPTGAATAFGNRPRPRTWTERTLPSWLANPELLPLGEHGLDIPYALWSARRTLRRHPGCEAIVVNADPYAACVVGAELKRQTGLPLVLDLRDPWAPCQLRRPRRPPPVRWIEDRLERACVEAADKVILNTYNTMHDYRAHYSDIAAQRFTCIRNHFDAELVRHGSHPGFDRYTLLFLGRFERFNKADVLLQILAELKRRGVSGDQLQLVVTGDFPDPAWTMAKGLGVADFVYLHAYVPYREIGPILDAADMLVALVGPGVTQRINAKLYDYLGAKRPILAISDNPEIAEMVHAARAGETFGHEEISAIADHVQREMKRGRQRDVPRRQAGLSSEEATGELAAVLHAVTGKG